MTKTTLPYPEQDRFALVRATNGRRTVYGTGYAITNTLVVTALHVVQEEQHYERPTTVLLRFEDTNGESIRRPATLCWSDASLDCALLSIEQRFSSTPPRLKWGSFDDSYDADWSSTGYPLANSVLDDSKREYRKASGLRGTILRHGGTGQGRRELELTVTNAGASLHSWNGISGAPVFVGDLLVGIITEVPANFGNARLIAVPADQLAQNADFARHAEVDAHKLIPVSTLINAPHIVTPSLHEDIRALIRTAKADTLGNVTATRHSIESVAFALIPHSTLPLGEASIAWAWKPNCFVTTSDAARTAIDEAKRSNVPGAVFLSGDAHHAFTVARAVICTSSAEYDSIGLVQVTATAFSFANKCLNIVNAGHVCAPDVQILVPSQHSSGQYESHRARILPTSIDSEEAQSQRSRAISGCTKVRVSKCKATIPRGSPIINSASQVVGLVTGNRRNDLDALLFCSEIFNDVIPI
jgi:hypothetical protein